MYIVLAFLSSKALVFKKHCVWRLGVISIDFSKSKSRPSDLGYVSTSVSLHDSHEEPEVVLCLTRIEASADSKQLRLKVLEGLLRESRMLGASTATPGNNWLHREFKDEGTKERLLRSKVET